MGGGGGEPFAKSPRAAEEGGPRRVTSDEVSPFYITDCSHMICVPCREQLNGPMIIDDRLAIGELLIYYKTLQ